jgi:hypothetical protein
MRLLTRMLLNFTIALSSSKSRRSSRSIASWRSALELMGSRGWGIRVLVDLVVGASPSSKDLRFSNDIYKYTVIIDED